VSGDPYASGFTQLSAPDGGNGDENRASNVGNLGIR
jgi:hypothetical protein